MHDGCRRWHEDQLNLEVESLDHMTRQGELDMFTYFLHCGLLRDNVADAVLESTLEGSLCANE